jgi:Bifunctional DNA primase/polymerase, N-terminal/Primase C terminal 1 (PriCT-1)
MTGLSSRPLVFSSKELLDAALSCSYSGLYVFPVRLDKSPMTAHDLNDATTDPATIERWWTASPAAAIGVACGPSRLVIIDRDPRHDPNEVGLRRLEQLTGSTRTRCVLTGSNGRHWHYRAPTGLDIRNSAGKLGAGLDVRANGGYIVVPPSRNQNGQYRWILEPDGTMLPIVELPAALLEALVQLQESISPKLQSDHAARSHRRPLDRSDASLATLGVIPEGRRNDMLFRFACSLRRQGKTETEIGEELAAVNHRQCEKPLSQSEVEQLVASALRYPPSVWRGLRLKQGGRTWEGARRV